MVGRSGHGLLDLSLTSPLKSMLVSNDIDCQIERVYKYISIVIKYNVLVQSIVSTQDS